MSLSNVLERQKHRSPLASHDDGSLSKGQSPSFPPKFAIATVYPVFSVYRPACSASTTIFLDVSAVYSLSQSSNPYPPTPSISTDSMEVLYSHTGRAPRDFPPFPHTLLLAPPICIRLAFHEIITIGFTSCADKIRCAHQWGRARANLLDFGNVVRERGCVDKIALVESVKPLVSGAEREDVGRSMVE